MIKFSTVEITHAKAGIDEIPFSNLFTERVDFQFSQVDIPKSRRDIQQLLCNLKELRDKKADQNVIDLTELNPKPTPKVKQEARKGDDSASLYNKCFVNAAKRVLWMNDEIKNHYKKNLTKFDNEMKDWDNEKFNGIRNEQQDCGEFVEEFLREKYEEFEELKKSYTTMIYGTHLRVMMVIKGKADKARQDEEKKKKNVNIEKDTLIGLEKETIIVNLEKDFEETILEYGIGRTVKYPKYIFIDYLSIDSKISGTTIQRDFLVPNKEGKILKYDLIAFAKHIKYTEDSGHYTAFTKCNNGWVLYNEEVITPIDNVRDDDLHKGVLFLYKQAPIRVRTCVTCEKAKKKCTATNPYDESECPQCKAKTGNPKCCHRLQMKTGRKRGSQNSTERKDEDEEEDDDETKRSPRSGDKRKNKRSGGGYGLQDNESESDSELTESKRIRKAFKAKGMNGRSEHESEQRSKHESEQRSNPSSVNPTPIVYNINYYGSTCNNNNSGRGEFSGNSYNLKE